VDETPLVPGGDPGSDDGSRRQIAVGSHRLFDVMDGLRDEGPVERQDDAVIVFDVGSRILCLRDGAVMVIFEVRVRKRLVVPVRPGRLVHMLYWRERQGRERRDEARRERARHEHHSDATGSTLRPQLNSL
jgi:hypothetical protein